MYSTLQRSDNFRRAAANASPPSRINFTGDEVSFHGNLSTTSAIATFWPIRTYRTLDTAAKNFQTNAARSTFVVAHTTPSPIPPQARGMRRRREVFSFLPTTPHPFFSPSFIRPLRQGATARLRHGVKTGGWASSATIVRFSEGILRRSPVICSAVGPARATMLHGVPSV